MRKTLATFAVVALALAGCGTTGEDEATVTNTKPPTSTSETSSSAAPTTESASTAPEDDPTEESSVPEPQAEVVPAEQTAAQAPTFVRCYLADGTALMSDGSTTYMDTCNESAGGPYLLEDGSPAITYSPEDYAEAGQWSSCVETNGTEYCTQQLYG